MPGNRICFFPGVPIVVTLHDIMEYMYLWQRYKKSILADKNIKMIFYKTRIAAYALVNYRFGFRKSQKIITVSEYSAEDISSKLKISQNKIIPIYHGLDRDYIHEDIIPLNKRPYTLMLGGDSYQKNPELAIRAWAKVAPDLRKRYPLKIVGFCGSESSTLLQAIKQNDLENEVEVKGWITQDEMVQNFRFASLFLFPSRYEGFGFPLIQAMASGTPVISTNQSSIPEVLGDAGLVYAPDDADGMAHGIEKILNNNAEWENQSTKGFHRSKLFSWKNSVRKHLELYESVFNGI
jgi:glycosyltransferase involved in cell wall biosynthesis